MSPFPIQLKRRSKIKGDREQHGFTVVEALVSFSIIALALHGFISATVTVLDSFRHTEQMHIASKIAQEGIELPISKALNHQACEDDPNCDNINDWQENLAKDGGVYFYEVDAAQPEQLLADGKFRELDLEDEDNGDANDHPGEGGPLDHIDLPDHAAAVDKFEPGLRPICVLDDKGIFSYCDNEEDGTELDGEFLRAVTIRRTRTNEGLGSGIKIVSTVLWQDRGRDRRIDIEALFYDD